MESKGKWKETASRESILETARKLLVAFTWSESDEGFDTWSAIYERLLTMAEEIRDDDKS